MREVHGEVDWTREKCKQTLACPAVPWGPEAMGVCEITMFLVSHRRAAVLSYCQGCKGQLNIQGWRM